MKSFLILGLGIVLLAANAAIAQPTRPKPDACRRIITQTEGRKIRNCDVVWMEPRDVRDRKMILTPEQVEMTVQDDETGYFSVPTCPQSWTYTVIDGFRNLDYKPMKWGICRRASILGQRLQPR
jgi:hypothetical protein